MLDSHPHPHQYIIPYELHENQFLVDRRDIRDEGKDGKVSMQELPQHPKKQHGTTITQHTHNSKT